MSKAHVCSQGAGDVCVPSEKGLCVYLGMTKADLQSLGEAVAENEGALEWRPDSSACSCDNRHDHPIHVFDLVVPVKVHVDV